MINQTLIAFKTNLRLQCEKCKTINSRLCRISKDFFSLKFGNSSAVFLFYTNSFDLISPRKLNMTNFTSCFSFAFLQFRLIFPMGNSEFRFPDYARKLHCKLRHNFHLGKLDRKFRMSPNFNFGKLL